MGEQTSTGRQGGTSSSTGFAERPLPPTPTDEEEARNDSSGKGKSILRRSSESVEEVPPCNNVQQQSSSLSVSSLRTADKYMQQYSQRLEEDPNDANAVSHANAGENSGHRLRLQESGSRSSYAGPNLRTLDIYGSSSDEGSEHEDVEEDHRLALAPRRISSGSTPQYPLHGQRDMATVTGSPTATPSLGQTRRRHSSRTEVIVPRWQPDAEVTFCPICRTQFSFFVRKHHCRKCGRVVCNSCSPHRITIPYQYIVQPPTEISTSMRRPSVDSARAGSATVVASLGGGERVRLCNPCVPDPNIAPPQTRSDQPSQHYPGHNRSASSAAVPCNRSSHGHSRNSRAQDSSTLGSPSPLRTWVAGSGATSQRTSTSYSGQDGFSLRPSGLDNRSRSSTLGTGRETWRMGTSQSRPVVNIPNEESWRDLIPINEGREGGPPRPPAKTPSPQSRSHTSRHRRIPEEDECWICHKELPSRTLPNFEALRESHVAACVQAALEPPPRSTPQQPPSTSRSRTSSSAAVAASSSSSSTEPIPNTPEARTAARERQHAAVVLGRPLNPVRSRPSLSRVIPYTASEKDCVDDAECTICLEEFEPGQEMGRLECFCRFHMSCIQRWYEQKPGKCPVHGVDD